MVRAVVPREVERSPRRSARRRRAGTRRRVAARARGCREPAGEPHAGDGGAPVVRRRQVVRLDRRRRRGGPPSGCARARATPAALADRQREARRTVHGSPALSDGQRREMELHVGRVELRPRCARTSALAMPTASGPVRVRQYCTPIGAAPAGCTSSFSVIGFVQRHITRACKWSCRFSPTPGSACTTAMPSAAAAAPGRCRRVAAVAATAARRRAASLRAAPRARVAARRADSARPRARPRTGSRRARRSRRRGSARLRAGRRKAAARRAAHAVAGRQLVIADAFLCRAVEVGRCAVCRARPAAGDERLEQLVLAPMSRHASGPPAPWYALAPRVVLELRK